MFLGDVPNHIKAMKRHIQDRNFAGVLDITHSFKGVCATMFATGMQEKCLAIESAGHDQNWQLVGKLVHELELEFNKIQKHVKNEE
jgi:HPt (histidine-containing phosphotransfer) domain-containing protein